MVYAYGGNHASQWATNVSIAVSNWCRSRSVGSRSFSTDGSRPVSVSCSVAAQPYVPGEERAAYVELARSDGARPPVGFHRLDAMPARHQEPSMASEQAFPYATNVDIKYEPLTVIDVPSLVAACTDRWYNQTLCRVNDSVVRLGVMQGEYHWHKHDDDDELFFVLEGEFIVDLEGRSVTLRAQEGFVVPKGVVHRTRAPERAVILMVETAAIVPTGD
jgi:mannose-6-phosphate isomerase-like protein (cupin superfamily)